jgi:hypothetical protein
MKSLLFAFALSLSMSAFAAPELPVCDLNAPVAPCSVNDEDAEPLMIMMILANPRGWTIYEDLEEEVDFDDDSAASGSITLQEVSADQNKLVFNFDLTFTCRPEVTTCKEYNWKVLLTMEGENATATDELIKVPREN